MFSSFRNQAPHLFILTQLCLFILTVSSRTGPDAVDLGYAKHRISFTNTTASGHAIHVHKNIRFAQPPTGKNRFLRPRLPPPTTSETENGMYAFDTRCVSAVPPGAGILFPGLNGTTFGNEDCLFLDVYVPDVVKPSDNVPILHWLHGSAYSFGSKETAFTPLGLFDELLGQEQPFVLVASNYRLGLYGWHASPYEDMDADAGLWDALAALRWTAEHAEKYGGNSSRITAMGQSTGAALIELLATSPRLANKLPFQRAFIASPALSLKRNVTERRQIVYEAVLGAVNCTDLDCLRSVHGTKLAEANQYLLNDVPALSGGGNVGPGIGFGPVVDQNLVADLPVAFPNLTKAAKGLEALITTNMGNEARPSSYLSEDEGANSP